MPISGPEPCIFTDEQSLLDFPPQNMGAWGLWGSQARADRLLLPPSSELDVGNIWATCLSPSGDHELHGDHLITVGVWGSRVPSQQGSVATRHLPGEGVWLDVNEGGL